MTEAEIAALESWGLLTWALKRGHGNRVRRGSAIECSRPHFPARPRGCVFIDNRTGTPFNEGRTFRWEREYHQATLTEHGCSTEGELAERWRASLPLRRGIGA